jgi:hypothetical protein
VPPAALVLGLLGGECELFAQGRGVHQDARCTGLPHHLGHFHHAGGEAQLAQVGHLQRGAVRTAHRRQLGGVADEQELGAGHAEDVLEEVGEQVAPVEGPVRTAVLPDHGGLVHHEEGVAVLVRRYGHAREPIVLAPHAVDAAVDGAGRCLRVAAEHLGGAAGGGQQYHRTTLLLQHTDQSAHEGGLAGTGVAF